MSNDKQRMRLGDDGSLDTVIVCADCGEEMRYNYDPCSGDQDEDETDDEAYANFIDWALDDAEDEHECCTCADFPHSRDRHCPTHGLDDR